MLWMESRGIFLEMLIYHFSLFQSKLKGFSFLLNVKHWFYFYRILNMKVLMSLLTLICIHVRRVPCNMCTLLVHYSNTKKIYKL